MVAKNNPKLTASLRRHVAAPEVMTMRWGENEALPGLWVRCSSRVTLAALAEMGRSLNGVDVDEENIAAAAEQFGPLLLAWNEAAPELDDEGEYVYDDGGQPKALDVPATLDGWRSCKPLMQVTVMRKYFELLGGVSVETLGKSLNGKQSRAPSETTELLSASLPS